MRFLRAGLKQFFVTFLFVTLLAGCTQPWDRNPFYGDNGTTFTASQGPLLISSTPVNGAVNVSLKTNIIAVFNKEMDPTTINTTTFLVRQGSTPVAGTVSYSGISAVFTPTVDLLASTLYTVTVTTGAKDTQGNALIHNEVWTFTTGLIADIIPPTVISTDPGNGSAAVSITTAITARFSEAIAPNSITATTFTLSQGGTAVAGSVVGFEDRAAFSPAANLTPNTLYTATITTGAKDLAGNPLAAPYVWTFTTGAAADVHPPTVVSVTPANLATNVVTHTAITAIFSEVMDPATINTTTFLVTQGGNAVSGTLTFVSTTATFQPTNNLLQNTLYTVTITTGAKDPSGHALAAPYVWTFTTGVDPDSTPPTVLSSTPANGGENIALNINIIATFSEIMDPSTINATTFTLLNGGNPVAGVVTYSGTAATFNPNADLFPFANYNVKITTGAKDAAGNAMVSDYSVSFFTTGNFQD